MNKQIDILADQKWKSTYIQNRVAKIKTTLSKIDQHDVLTSDDWKDIVYLSNDLLDQAGDLQEVATYEYQRTIGD